MVRKGSRVQIPIAAPYFYGDVAHLVERSIRIAEVVGSSPIVSTML